MGDMPWFPMWAADFVNARAVRTMTPEQVGVYILLLCHEWNDGPIPDDDRGLRVLANNAEVSTVRDVLEQCFDLTSDGWVNGRLEEVRSEQESKRERHARAGKKGAEVRWAQGDNSTANGKASSGASTNPNSNQSQSQSKRKENNPTPYPSPADAVSGGYPQDFEEVRRAYPLNPNDNKRNAYKAWLATVRKGHTPAELLAGAKRYAEYCFQEKTPKQFRKHMATFFGPDAWWKQDWAPTPKDHGKPSPDSQAAKVRDEKPQATAPRQTEGLEPIGGKPPDRKAEVEAWLKWHPDEAAELLRECQEEMAFVLSNTKRPDTAAGLIKASLHRKVLAILDKESEAA